MQTTRRSWLMSTALLAGLAGCGFELRKPPRYAFQTFYSNIPVSSPLGLRLIRILESSGQVEVITNPREIERADVIFESLGEFREKVVVGRSVTGAIRELQLRLQYRFRVRSRNGVELIPDSEVVQTRDINYSETGALSKESEELLLYKDMENDLAFQLQRRLAAIRKI